MAEAGLLDCLLKLPSGFRCAELMITKKLVLKFRSIAINKYNDKISTTLQQ
jgi:hypothetical protein